MANLPLARQQQEILTAITDHVKERGYPPSIREIGRRVGLSSPSTIAHHLRLLEARGYIRRDPFKPRAIRVMQEQNQ